MIVGVAIGVGCGLASVVAVGLVPLGEVLFYFPVVLGAVVFVLGGGGGSFFKTIT